MDSIIGLLKDTPIPTILVVSGIVFLFLALAGSVAGKLEMPPARQKWSAVASLVLLISGLLLYILPAGPEGAAASPSSTPLPQAASQPIAPTAVPAGAQEGALADQSSSLPAAPVAEAGNPGGGAGGVEEGCLAEFFTAIPADLITSLEVGAGKSLHYAPEQPAGMVLEEFGQPVAALSYMVFEDDQIFKIIAAVDAACQPAAFANASRGGAPEVLINWDTLEVTTPGGVYALRFGYGSGEANVVTSKID